MRKDMKITVNCLHIEKKRGGGINKVSIYELGPVYGWLQAEILVRGLGVFVEENHISTSGTLHKDNCKTTTESLNYQHT